jgi:mediator of RNA polymerase II transcription subunit 20
MAAAAEFPRDFIGISLMELPNKYFFIIRGHKLVVEADSSILTIMEKLQSYKSKVTLNFEVLFYFLFSLHFCVFLCVFAQLLL